jgi:DNA polymerase-3 subunit epsilon
MIKMFYDTETTGLDYKKCSIHQFSAIIEVDDTVVQSINLHMRPHDKAVYEDGALATHGITKETMLKYPAWQDQFKVLKHTILKYASPFDKEKKIHLVGFKNASFDDDFFKMLFDLADDKFWFYFFASSIDVSCLAAEYLLDRRAKMPSFKLHRVAKTLGIYVDDTRLHDGVYDCELTRQIYRIVTRREEEGLM